MTQSKSDEMKAVAKAVNDSKGSKIQAGAAQEKRKPRRDGLAKAAKEMAKYFI